MTRRAASAAVTLAALAMLAAIAAGHAADVGAALAAVPAWAVVAAVALHLATLAVRSEAWRVTLDAAPGARLPRGCVHAANAGAFAVGTVQSHAALPARVAFLRRLAGPDAPGYGAILVADVPIFALELAATALLLVAAAVAGRGAWWVAPVALALAAGVLLAARLAPERFARRPCVRGLAVLGDRRRRTTLAALVATIVALTGARVWIVLAVSGLPHTLGDVAWVFAALGVFGLLPLGPGAPAGATLAALGGTSVGGAMAAGLLLGASSIVAVLAYALIVAACHAAAVVVQRSRRWRSATARSHPSRLSASAHSSRSRKRSIDSSRGAAAKAVRLE